MIEFHIDMKSFQMKPSQLQRLPVVDRLALVAQMGVERLGARVAIDKLAWSAPSVEVSVIEPA